MSQRNNQRQSGFALILALLSLALLTTMGLALANSTGVELQIASNQRWSESARYNAEAGLEYGKILLMNADWGALLPPARVTNPWLPTAWANANAPDATAPWTRATRNFESYRCDEQGYGMGYGVVLDDGTTEGPYEFVSELAGATLNGAFTLWIRRPVMWVPTSVTGVVGTTLRDYPEDDVIMIVSEGVAPYTGIDANATGMAAFNRSTYVVEALLTRKAPPVLDQSACNTRQGQAGGSSSGGNTAGCVSLTAGRQITEALGNVASRGTGELK